MAQFGQLLMTEVEQCNHDCKPMPWVTMLRNRAAFPLARTLTSTTERLNKQIMRSQEELRVSCV